MPRSGGKDGVGATRQSGAQAGVRAPLASIELAALREEARMSRGGRRGPEAFWERLRWIERARLLAKARSMVRVQLRMGLVEVVDELDQERWGGVRRASFEPERGGLAVVDWLRRAAAHVCGEADATGPFAADGKWSEEEHACARLSEWMEALGPGREFPADAQWIGGVAEAMNWHLRRGGFERALAAKERIGLDAAVEVPRGARGGRGGGSL